MMYILSHPFRFGMWLPSYHHTFLCFLRHEPHQILIHYFLSLWHLHVLCWYFFAARPTIHQWNGAYGMLYCICTKTDAKIKSTIWLWTWSSIWHFSHFAKTRGRADIWSCKTKVDGAEESCAAYIRKSGIVPHMACILSQKNCFTSGCRFCRRSLSTYRCVTGFSKHMCWVWHVYTKTSLNPYCYVW